HPGGHVALVTHSVVIMSMVAAALRLDLEHLHRLRISNTSVTTLCGTEPPGSLLTLNDVYGVYGSPVASAVAQDCVRWKLRRVTQ
ncbi:MAG: histidine phosphatase family protein, partial [Chloroflexi bacterium]|nr:histidine phosphatase family protein [Chloroflexota bacterium]